MIREAAGAPQHLGRCPSGEGKQQDPVRWYPVLDEVSDPARQGPRLAATRAGDYQQRTPLMEDGSALPVVQAIEPRGHFSSWGEHLFDTSSPFSTHQETKTSPRPYDSASATCAPNGRTGRLLQKAITIDDNALMSAVGDDIFTFYDPELERNGPAFDCEHMGPSGYCGIQLRRLDVMELSVDANRRLPALETFAQRSDGGLLCQSQHPRRGQHRHLSGSVCNCRVVVPYNESDLGVVSRLDHGLHNSHHNNRYRELESKEAVSSETRAGGRGLRPDHGR
jgi:hypothetical protein